ncbi:uncharacterized protein LOC116212912 isoform X2 [Punica granatum]|uniref:Uncharacterized protein LOC116212912 isoform X2 n=1 Tax=Punica granatum TaxID=22663 RepID=A0A6P8EDU5_PUNGR|nr:uncharacterized protein LOC116212912 isoform X2 [Punica granatum]
MAGLSFSIRPSSLTSSPATVSIFHGMRCCCSRIPPDHAGANKHGTAGGETPQLLKIAVSGVTELLRILSPLSKRRSGQESFEQIDEISVSGIDDVVSILESDYEKAYFVTGIFSSGIYAEDCVFEDPTIRFRGRDLYQRNLKLLVPFFDQPSIELKNIEKGEDAEEKFILATWKLRSYLRLPWRPLISIDGRTVYELDNNFEIVRHAESWNVSSLQAIGQIFTPNFGRSNHD